MEQNRPRSQPHPADGDPLELQKTLTWKHPRNWPHPTDDDPRAWKQTAIWNSEDEAQAFVTPIVSTGYADETWTADDEGTILTLEDCRERLYGSVVLGGVRYGLTEQAMPTNRAFPGWWGDARDGEPYVSEYSALAVNAETGARCRVFWQFHETKNREAEADGLDWKTATRIETL